MSQVAKLTKTIGYALGALMALIRDGQGQRVYRQERAERYIEASKRYMFPKELWDSVVVMDADDERAVERLGKAYLTGRTKVLVVLEPHKVREIGLTDPSGWFGTEPTIGRDADGKDKVNAGQHRGASVDLTVADTLRQVPDLEIDREKVKVPVILKEGELADHGVLENTSREDDNLREQHDMLYVQYQTDPVERREHWAGQGFSRKVIQGTFSIIRIVFNTFFTFPRELKVYNPGLDTKEKIKSSDYVENGTNMGKVKGLAALGKRLRKFFQVSLENARVKAADLPSDVKDAWPFRLTYVRLAELVNCAIVDGLRALTDPEIMKMPAENRPLFEAAWRRFSAEGWESSSNGGGQKSVKNPIAARSIRDAFEDGTEEEKAKAKVVADSFESGQPAPALTELIRVAANPISPADVFAKLAEAFDAKGSKKIAEKEAYRLSKEAVALAFSEKG